MSNDLRGQLSQVGPPADGVIGDLPVAKSKRRPTMLAILGVVIIVAGYVAFAGRAKTPDPVELGLKTSAENPGSSLASVQPSTARISSQVTMQTSGVTSPIQGTAQAASSPGAVSDQNNIQVNHAPTSTSTSTSVLAPAPAPPVKDVKVMVKPVLKPVATPIAKAKIPPTKIDAIGISEE